MKSGVTGSQERFPLLKAGSETVFFLDNQGAAHIFTLLKKQVGTGSRCGALRMKTGPENGSNVRQYANTFLQPQECVCINGGGPPQKEVNT